MEKKFKDTLVITNIKLSESLESGNKYKCIIILAGETNTPNLTLNINNNPIALYKCYTAESIKDAIDNGLFENAPALLRSTESHLKVENTGINSYCGNFTNTSWNESIKGAEAIFNPTWKIKTKLAELYSSGKTIGLSISADVSGYLTTNSAGKDMIVVTKFNDLQSIDPVAAGNAGGKITALVAESIRNNLNNNFKLKTGESQMNKEMKQKIFDLLSSANLVGEGKTIDNISDDDIVSALLQHAYTLMNTVDTSLSEAEQTAKKNEIASLLAFAINKGNEKMTAIVAEAKKLLIKTPAAESKKTDEPTDLQKMEILLNDAKKLNSQNYLNTKVGESKLPTPIKDKIHKLYDGTTLTNREVDNILVAEQEAYKVLDPSFINNSGMDIKRKADEVDKFALTMEYLMLDPTTFRTKMSEVERDKYKSIIGNYSFKELYTYFTGDSKIKGKLFKGSIAESISTTTFAEIMGVSMHRSMLREYTTSAFNQDWKKFIQIVPRSDFKANTVALMGGYDDFPIVTQGNEYQASTTPGEDAVSYALLKRGYTETITMEAIRNDDLGAIRRIPVKWGRVAARVIYKYVMNNILNNVAMAYDTKALLHVDHANIIAKALDGASYFEVIQLLYNQTEKNSAETLALIPAFLLISLADAKTAYELTQPAALLANNVPNFYQTFKVEPIIMAGQTDKSWRVVADPSCATLYELGFLDGNEEPEMFTQDLPTQGYAFSNDGIKMKVRHIYAGKLTDHRAIAGSIVANP